MKCLFARLAAAGIVLLISTSSVVVAQEVDINSTCSGQARRCAGYCTGSQCENDCSHRKAMCLAITVDPSRKLGPFYWAFEPWKLVKQE